MNVMGIIFSNGVGLGDLTGKRTTASLPYGGRYRQVDFHLSNMAHAGIRHIGIFSRHNYQSLVNHIGSGEEWGLELGEGGLEFLTPFAMSTNASHHGKLEQLYFAMDFLEFGPEDEYLVMADANILCNIDLSKVLNSHVESGRDLTVVTKTGIANGCKTLDLAFKLGEQGEVIDVVVDYAATEDYAASMDIFVMSKRWLVQQVKEHMAHNRRRMDRDLVLGLWQKNALSINAYPYDGVAMFTRSVEEYFHHNLALIQPEIRHDLFREDHPIFTKVRDRVPSYYGEECAIENCIVADGCVLEGTATNCVLFRQVTLGKNVKAENCIIMNDTVVGEGSELKYVILDKDVVVRPGSTLIGTATNPVIIKRGDIV